MECPFCREDFEPWKEDGLSISCKDCSDFHDEKYKHLEWDLEE